MSNYIIIPRDAMRHALSDLLLNLTSIVTAVCCAERDIPMIQLCMGIDTPLKLSFNNVETRDLYFHNIMEICKPVSVAIPADVTPSKVPASKSDAKRRASRD